MTDTLREAQITPLDERTKEALALIRTKCAVNECESQARFLAYWESTSNTSQRNLLCDSHAKWFCDVNKISYPGMETPKEIA